jgi:hypothetical protein
MGSKIEYTGFLRQAIGSPRVTMPEPGTYNINSPYLKVGGYMGQRCQNVPNPKFDVSPATYQMDRKKEIKNRPKSATTFGREERIP